MAFLIKSQGYVVVLRAVTNLFLPPPLPLAPYLLSICLMRKWENPVVDLLIFVLLQEGSWELVISGSFPDALASEAPGCAASWIKDKGEGPPQSHKGVGGALPPPHATPDFISGSLIF